MWKIIGYKKNSSSHLESTRTPDVKGLVQIKLEFRTRDKLLWGDPQISIECMQMYQANPTFMRTLVQWLNQAENLTWDEARKDIQDDLKNLLGIDNEN